MPVTVIALLMILVEHTQPVQLSDLCDDGSSGQAEHFLHLAQAGKTFPVPVFNAFRYVQIDQKARSIQLILPDIALNLKSPAANTRHIIAVGSP